MNDQIDLIAAEDTTPADAIRETPDSVYQKSHQLAIQIEAYCQRTGKQFDYLVVIPRGGYFVANIVARELAFSATDLLHAGIKSYQPDNTQSATLQIGQMPTREEVTGKDLLIIDEVCDTGETLQFVKNYLLEATAASVQSAVLHYKPKRSTTGFVPEFYVEKTNHWIIYPWEASEQRGKQSVAHRQQAESV
jgi:hypoxanthine phosphoribosyltransferase